MTIHLTLPANPKQLVDLTLPLIQNNLTHNSIVNFYLTLTMFQNKSSLLAPSLMPNLTSQYLLHLSFNPSILIPLNPSTQANVLMVHLFTQLPSFRCFIWPLTPCQGQWYQNKWAIMNKVSYFCTPFYTLVNSCTTLLICIVLCTMNIIWIAYEVYWIMYSAICSLLLYVNII